MPCAPVDTDTLSTDDMHVAYARAAGLDVHKMHITATVRLCEAGSGPSRTATREFSALPDGLMLKQRGFLTEAQAAARG